MKNVFFLAFFIFFSCSEKKENIEQVEINKEPYSVTIEFKSNYNNVFRLFYSDSPDLEITGENLIEKYIFGSDDMQKVVFKLPQGEQAYKLRLDVGTNQKVDLLSIKNISISYNNKIIDGNDGLFMKYWNPNQSLIYDSSNFIYNVVPIDGVKSPMFMSNESLNNEILNIVK